MQHDLEDTVQKRNEPSFGALMGPARDIFEQWISFFPTAPLFGVPWRFAPKSLDQGMDRNPWTAWMPGARESSDRAGKAPEQVVPVPVRKPAAPAPEAASTVAPRTAAPSTVAPRTAPEPAPKPAAAPANVEDDLTRLRGIGPKLASDLSGLGITALAQIAAFTAEDLARIDAALTSIKGRCYRDDWVGQARALLA